MVQRFIIYILSTIFFQEISAQKEVIKGWHLLDATQDGYHGISLKQAKEFLKNKNPQITRIGSFMLFKPSLIFYGGHPVQYLKTSEDLNQMISVSRSNSILKKRDSAIATAAE